MVEPLIYLEPIISDDRIEVPASMMGPAKDVRSAIFALGKANQFSDFDDVEGIFYETDDEMAKRVLKRIKMEAMDRFQVSEVSIIHRVGNIPLGEYIYLVMVWSRRSEDAFNACKFVVEEISGELPMWKYEVRKNRSPSFKL